MGQVIAIVSGKGGTGKTSFTAGIATCLAAMGKRVVAIDVDNGLRNLDISLGMQDQVFFDFTDILEKRVNAQQAVASHPVIKNLKFLSAPLLTQIGENTKSRFFRLIALLSSVADYVIIDSAAGIGESFSMALKPADAAVVVATPDAASLRDAQRTGAEISKAGKEQVFLVLNRINPKLVESGDAFSIDDAIDRSGIRLLGIIPEDFNVIACANKRKAVILEENNGAAEAYFNIAKRLLGEKVPLMRLSHGKWKLTM